MSPSSVKHQAAPVGHGADPAEPRHTQRLAWLRAHPDLGIAVRRGGPAVAAAAIELALRGMRLEQLYAPAASSDRVRADIRALVAEIRP